MRRMTTTGVLKRLGPQTDGRAAADDFIALPCSHPDCCAITYFVRGDDGRHRSIPKLVGLERLKANLSVVGNRIAADDELWDALIGMMSETTTISRPELVDYLLNICEACDIGIGGFIKDVGSMLFRGERAAELVAKRTKRLSVKSFMDAWTLNIERLQQCCVHVGSTDAESDPVRIPFCARQLFGNLRRRTSAGHVPARQLVQLDGAAARP
jgi:7,8-dihydro-6-hydroxymethylpterin dimethyltransferase